VFSYNINEAAIKMWNYGSGFAFVQALSAVESQQGAFAQSAISAIAFPLNCPSHLNSFSHRSQPADYNSYATGYNQSSYAHPYYYQYMSSTGAASLGGAGGSTTPSSQVPSEIVYQLSTPPSTSGETLRSLVQLVLTVTSRFLSQAESQFSQGLPTSPSPPVKTENGSMKGWSSSASPNSDGASADNKGTETATTL
jgi:hypothetical protein